jgi:NADH-quinone oxidoreductase subunit F
MFRRGETTTSLRQASRNAASPLPPSAFVDRAVEEIGREPEALIPLLQAIQEEYRYLPEEALRRLSEVTSISAADVAGVSSFYSQFRLRPVGRHIIRVCHGTACHVKGAELVNDALRRCLHVEGEEDTDATGEYTIERVACLGCCTLAPVIQVDDVVYGNLRVDTARKALDDFQRLCRDRNRRAPQRRRSEPAKSAGEIRITLDSCCVAGGTQDVRDALDRAVQEQRVSAVIKPVSCVGLCHQIPMIEVVVPGEEPKLYAKVSAQEAEEIVRRHFRPADLLSRLRAVWSATLDRLLTDETWEPVTRFSVDVRDSTLCAYLGKQVRIATEHSGRISPLALEEYTALGGFAALKRCLQEGNPDGIIETITRSGLRGRGGAGFPTGIKWSRVRSARGKPKYIVCNGDEGDPGAFMDRMLLESFPYRVLEGIILAAYAVGANQGYLYIRAEYPLAVKNVSEAIRRCEAAGYLGENIFGSGFSLTLKVVQGAGAFVCGEETALIASLEGQRGIPRLRPPYPAESGLWGKPTCINNVETYALVSWILRQGAEAFARLGTQKSKGTKVFALAGRVTRGGLIEVPMGVTIRQIVEEIGGGVPEGRTFKAVQIGGPSGGCIPAALADTPVDYEALREVGAIMGSGGLVVLDDRDCMVDIARYFLEFTQKESCGQCTLCRIGTRRLLDILERICAGQGRAGDLEKLEELAKQVAQGSLCGLGQTAPNPVLTTLRYFREEYEAHLQGRCPAGRCRALLRYRITESCIGCTLCAQECPVGAIQLRPFERHRVLDERCIRCDACRKVCPENAVTLD